MAKKKKQHGRRSTRTPSASKAATSYKDIAVDFMARMRQAASAEARAEVLTHFEKSVAQGKISRDTLRRAAAFLKTKYKFDELKKHVDEKYPKHGRGRTALQLGEEGDYSMMEDTEQRPFVRTPGGCLHVKKGGKVRVRATDERIVGVPDGPKIILYPARAASRASA